MKYLLTIEARMRSSRLPGKVLMPIMGVPMLALMIERLKNARMIDGIVVATTDNGSEDPIAKLAGEMGVGCFRGSEEDVLLRVLKAAQHYEADVIVETTGDCPLNDPAIVDKVVADYRI
jgi:spore coat polysaccharide biosynthesis protein SpsF